MRRVLLAGAVIATFGTIGVASALAAGSNGTGHQQATITAPCSISGGETLYVSYNGQSAWTSDSHYVIASLSLTGPQPPNFDKVYGTKNGFFGTTVTCTGDWPTPDTTFIAVLAPTTNS